MELTDAIRQRRSVKNFDPQHRLTEDEIRHLLSHAILSPTSFNMQNWHFVAVTDREVQEELCEAAWNQAHVRDCSMTLVICGRLKGWEDMSRQLRNAPENVREMFGGMVPGFYSHSEELQRDEAVRSVGIAGQTIMLLAKDMGYDSCPMIGFDGEKVAELINLPQHYALSFMIPVGKQAQPGWERGDRLADDRVVAYDKFA